MSAKNIAAIVVVVVVLVGAFFVYPAVAAPIAKDRVENGIESIAAASDVKLEGVNVDVGGTNAFSALINGKAVGDISVRIDRIIVSENAVAGETPQLKPGAEEKAADGVRDVLDAIESVGSFEVALNEIVSGKEKLALNYSSFKLSDGTYRFVLRIPKPDIDRVLEPLGVTLDVVANGSTISGKFSLGNPTGGEPIEQEFRIDIKPADGGKSLSVKLDDAPAEKIPLELEGATVSELSFSTEGNVYEITIGGDYDYDATRNEIEKSLDEIGPTG